MVNGIYQPIYLLALKKWILYRVKVHCMPDMQRLKSPTSMLIMPSLSASSSQASPSPSLSASSWPEFGTNTQLSWKPKRKTQAEQFFLTLGWTECERRWGMLKVVPGYSCCLCTEAYYQDMHQYLCPFHTHSHCQPNQPHTDIHTQKKRVEVGGDDIFNTLFRVAQQ